MGIIGIEDNTVWIDRLYYLTTSALFNHTCLYTLSIMSVKELNQLLERHPLVYPNQLLKLE